MLLRVRAVLRDSRLILGFNSPRHFIPRLSHDERGFFCTRGPSGSLAQNFRPDGFSTGIACVERVGA